MTIIRYAIFYSVGQVLVGILGAVLLRLLFSEVISLGATNPSGGIMQALISGDIVNLWLYLTTPVEGSVWRFRSIEWYRHHMKVRKNKLVSFTI